MPESGYANCPCCGDIIIVGDIANPPLCADCKEAGCEMTRDGCGQLGYWECQQEEDDSRAEGYEHYTAEDFEADHFG